MKYKPNAAGLKEQLRGPAAQTLVHGHAERVRAAAGDGYVASYMQGKNRYRAIVYAETMKAKRREARENVLVRVLG